MTEQEQKDLAGHLADVSSVFDLETALRLVQANPAGAEELLRMRKESKRRQEKLARVNERLHLAALEFR
jgi:hypothetical protein